MTVNLMRPHNYIKSETSAQSDFRVMCEARLFIRGDMPLLKLREKIICQADLWRNLEDTEDASEAKNFFMVIDHFRF